MTNPLFTGVSEPSSFGATGKRGNANIEAGWLEKFAHNPDISLATHGSGLTDLERKRLCLDPARSGADSVALDQWPNVKNRPLTNAEQVLAAAFEAFFHFDRSESVALFIPAFDMSPFEMAGRCGPTIWGSSSPEDTRFRALEECDSSGLLSIGFSPIHFGKIPWQERLIDWGKDHQTATVRMYSEAWTDGTAIVFKLQKINSTWFVVDVGDVQGFTYAVG